MADITMRHVKKSFGPVDVIKGVDLDIRNKEFVVFVGPSGCGKSTLLRLVAGLEDITSGRLMFDGEEVNDLPPAERGIAMVFQSYALYPHMSVYENMAFGLKLAKLGKEGIEDLAALADAGDERLAEASGVPAEVVREQKWAGQARRLLAGEQGGRFTVVVVPRPGAEQAVGFDVLDTRTREKAIDLDGPALLDFLRERAAG